MTRFSVTIATQAPSRVQRAWYRRLGLDVPQSVASTGPRYADLVRLLPYQWRTVHKAFAATHGYFWIPCPLCGQPFGGHEAGSSIPDPTNPPLYVCICSRCTRHKALA
jgi:hypothetical protein